ncbi:cytochrome c biogenesis protein DipZ, partial [Schumannella luteola]
MFIGLVGGLLTGISPCILPVLPVVFLGGATRGTAGTAAADARPSRARPLLIVLGLTLSFAVFTLFGTVVLTLLHLPADLIRWLGLIVLVLLGLAMIVPAVGHLVEKPFAWIPQRYVDPDRGGFVLGLALGAVFVPCAGPVLAAITVAGATGALGWGTVTLTLAFAVGCAIPLLVFALAGQQLVTRIAAFRKRQRLVQIVSGSVMIALAIALTFNVTDLIQRTIPNYTEAVAAAAGSGVKSALGGERSGADKLLHCQIEASYDVIDGDDCGPAPEFAGIEQWLNTPGDAPLTMAGLEGRVVLVDFWAYSCINC